MTATSAVQRLEGDSRYDACNHADMEYLGQDVTAFFHRCRSCGLITIAQGGRGWTLRPRMPSPAVTV